MKVLVCGARDWDDYRAIWNRLKKLPKGTTIIHGNCRGADQMAGAAAEALGLKVIKEPALWNTLGKAAGLVRNQDILDEHHPDLVIAFHHDLDQSKGTKDMISRAKLIGIKVEEND